MLKAVLLKGEAEKYRIAASTVSKVKKLAKALNFSPDIIATSLTTRKTKTIGVIFPNVFEPFMNKMIKGIEEYLYPSGYSMILCTSRFDKEVEKRNIEMLIQRNVDGIILVFSAPFCRVPHDYSHIHQLVHSGIPLVFADRFLPDVAEKTNVVIADDFAGAFDASRRIPHRGYCQRYLHHKVWFGLHHLAQRDSLRLINVSASISRTKKSGTNPHNFGT